MTTVTRHTRNLTRMPTAAVVLVIGLLLWLLTPGVVSLIGFLLTVVAGVVLLVDLVSTLGRGR